LELLICLVKQITGNSDIVEHCPLGPDVQESKSSNDLPLLQTCITCLKRDNPKSAWRAGVVIVSNTQWYFREFQFNGEDFVEDKHGLTYFPVTLSDHETCLVGNELDRQGNESTNNNPLLIGYIYIPLSGIATCYLDTVT
jgi:hypothetical protein